MFKAQWIRASFSFAALVVALAGCSAKVEGGGGGPVFPGPETFESKVTGPSIEGQWRSLCVRDRWSDGGTGYKIFDIEISGKSVHRVETKFGDSSCRQQTEQVVLEGMYRFIEKFDNEVYYVEYRFKAGGGYVLPKENVKLTYTRLFIGDRYGGSGMAPDIELSLIGTNPGNPTDPTKPSVDGFNGQWLEEKCQQGLSTGTGTRASYLIQGTKAKVESVQFGDYPTCKRASKRATTEAAVTVVDASRIRVGSQELVLGNKDGNKSLSIGAVTLIPIALPTAHAPIYASSCPSFAGMWQMNNTYFKMIQNGCERVLITAEDTPSFASSFFDFDYLPDGQAWNRYQGTITWTKTSFNGAVLMQDYDFKRNDGTTGQRTEKVFLSKQPCNLMNPTGEDYLVMEYHDRASGTRISCNYFARWRN